MIGRLPRADDEHRTQGDLRQRSSPNDTRIDRLRYGPEKASSGSGLDIEHRVFQSVAKLAASRRRNLPEDILFMHALDPRRDIDIEHLSTRMEAGNILVKITAASLAEDVGVIRWGANGYRSRRSAE